MNTVIIKKIIMHMLDFEHRQIHRSSTFVDLNETSLDYYHKKLEKTLNAPTMKELAVGSLHELILRSDNMLMSDEEFVRHSQEIAEQIYRLGSVIEAMPNCNIMVADVDKDGQKHIVIVKLNYRVIPMSVVEDHFVRITKQQVLPTAGSVIDEAIIINKETNQLFLIEKKYMIDGKMDYYLNPQWIKGEEKKTDKEKYDAMKRVVRKLDEFYQVNDGNAFPLMKQEMKVRVDNNQPVKPIEIVKKVLEKDYQAQEESEIMMKDMGINEDDQIQHITMKQIEKCKLVLDGKIEINLPIDTYLTGENLEKKQEGDGTFSLVVKDIHEIIVK